MDTLHDTNMQFTTTIASSTADNPRIGRPNLFPVWHREIRERGDVVGRLRMSQLRLDSSYGRHTIGQEDSGSQSQAGGWAQNFAPMIDSG